MASSSQIAATVDSFADGTARDSSDVPLCHEFHTGTMSIAALKERGSVDAHPPAPIDAGTPSSSDARDARVVQDDRAKGMPVDEGTCLIEAVEASYEEAAATTLSSNKGEFSLVHVSIFMCMQGTTLMIMVTWISLVTR